MGCGDFGGGSAADGEVGGDGHFAGFEGGNEVVEDRVGDGFVEDAFVAVGEEVELESLHLDAEFIGDVGDGDGGEVGLAGDGAEAGEFGEGEFDFVVALGGGVGEGFEDDARGGELRGGQDGFLAEMGEGRAFHYWHFLGSVAKNTGGQPPTGNI